MEPLLNDFSLEGGLKATSEWIAEFRQKESASL
jgi:hypothetical protein